MPDTKPEGEPAAAAAVMMSNEQFATLLATVAESRVEVDRAVAELRNQAAGMAAARGNGTDRTTQQPNTDLLGKVQ